MDSGVEGLDATAEQLRVAGHLLDRRDRNPGCSRCVGGAAARDELDAELVKPVRERVEAALVVDRQESAADFVSLRGA